MAEPAISAKDAPRRVNRLVAITSAVLLTAVAAALYFAFAFVEDERARTLQEWQVRLGIVADSRVADLNNWVDGNFNSLKELAENASLQLYMTELALAEGDSAQITDEAAQAAYLRTLLVAVSERTGFKPPEQVAQVNANVERVGVAGLGLVNASGRPIVSTPGMVPVTGRIRAAVAKALSGEATLIDVYRGATNLPTIGFVLPIYGIQESEGAEGIGAVIGIRVIGEDLFKRLKQPGETEETAESYLVRATKTQVEYLSPLADGTPPLRRALALDTPDLAASFALATPGGFAIKKNYASNEVLITSRPMAQLPWVLVRTVSRDEALSGAENRLRTIMIVFILLTVGVLIAIIAVWKHGSSLRATQAAENYRVAAERFENLSKFMDLIANSQAASIVAVSGDTEYTYANRPAAREAGIPAPDMIGKTLGATMGPVRAKVFADINRQILKEFERTDDRDGTRQAHVLTFGDEADDDIVVIKSDHIPLRGDRDHPPGVLMITEDITEMTRERRLNEQMMRQLTRTLMGVVDRRNPGAEGFSDNVSVVARAIAREMNCDSGAEETVRMAATLMNLGSLHLSPALLMTKPEDLSADDQARAENSYLDTADILRDVPFKGPVLETILQSGEHWDGSGPLGLKEDTILLTARILAVANALVRLIMPLEAAEKEAPSFEEAMTILLRETGRKYDRRCVSALLHHLENRGGREDWAHFRHRPKGDTA